METYLKSFMCADVANLIVEYLLPDYRENYNLAMRSLLWRRSPVFESLIDGDNGFEYIDIFTPDDIDYVCDYDVVVYNMKNVLNGVYIEGDTRPLCKIVSFPRFKFIHDNRPAL